MLDNYNPKGAKSKRQKEKEIRTLREEAQEWSC